MLKQLYIANKKYLSTPYDLYRLFEDLIKSLHRNKRIYDKKIESFKQQYNEVFGYDFDH